MVDKEIEDIYKKYGAKIEKEVRANLGNQDFAIAGKSEQGTSREYERFKQESSPDLNKFEKLCKGVGNSLKIKPSQKDAVRIQKKINEARIDVTPTQVLSLSFVSALLFLFFGVVICILLFHFILDSFPLSLLFLFFISSLFVAYYVYSLPERLANQQRLRLSSQMVPCILYVVAYMKHTSNLERAVAFASSHLKPPLSSDLKKVFWDVESGKYSTLKQSLESYLGTWKEKNIEFVESFHLIESSLFEASEERRIAVLEKALQVVLDGVYEKMLKYSHEVRSPLTNIYMLGIILPTLAIALLPLASTLLGDLFQWHHVFLLFNLIIPFFVFYMTNEVLMKRPGGYGESEVLESSPDYHIFQNKKHYVIAFLLCLPFLVLGLLPFIFQTSIVEPLGLESDYTFEEVGLGALGEMRLFDFKSVPGGGTTGPFGSLALILSLFIPVFVGLGFSIAYERKTKQLIKSRQKSKNLEKEFASSLFQLGNRLGDGMPAEVAFAHIAESLKGQTTAGFFNLTNVNMRQAGMSLEEAIFNPKRGSIIYYPSSLIATSMKILVESIKKGLNIAARTLMSISEYVKNIHKIEERLRDLLAEVVSDMKSNMVFLAPLLAGIVVGLAGMITFILERMMVMIEEVGVGGLEGGVADMAQFFGPGGMFNLEYMIPPYFLQIAVGIYIIQIVFILSNTLVTVDAGPDKLQIINETGKNLRRSLLLYLIVALLSILALSLLAGIALGGLI